MSDHGVSSTLRQRSRRLLAGAALLALVTATPAQAQTPSPFRIGPSNPLGGEIVSVATGDLNGDGVVDVLATANSANELGIYLGRGDGTFNAKGAVGVDVGPISVAIGDVNRDGHRDAVVGYGGTSISVLLGRGDGTLSPAHDFGPIESSTAHVALADVDGDGCLDVIAGDSTIFHGSCNGTFTVGAKPFGHPTGMAPYAIADLNGDGIGDFVTASTKKNGSVAVVLSRPDGTWRPAKLYQVSAASWATLADVNRDGTPDIVVGGNYGPKAIGGVSVLLGQGGGVFHHRSDRTVGTALSAGAVTDLDGDGKPDVVVVGDNTDRQSASVWVLHGKGNGTLATPAKYGPIAPASGWAKVVTADLNGDTRPDILVTTRTAFTTLMNNTKR